MDNIKNEQSYTSAQIDLKIKVISKMFALKVTMAHFDRMTSKLVALIYWTCPACLKTLPSYQSEKCFMFKVTFNIMISKSILSHLLIMSNFPASLRT